MTRQKASRIGLWLMLLSGITGIVIVWWNAFHPMSHEITDAWTVTCALVWITGFVTWVMNYD